MRSAITVTVTRTSVTESTRVARQLVLPMPLDAEATFRNFFAHSGAAEAVHGVRRALNGEVDGAFVWGQSGRGRSHLLQAACNARGTQARYLPLWELSGLPGGALLEGCEQALVLAIDDLDAITADPDWQRALFDAFNRCRAAAVPMLFAAGSPPDGFADMLPDLRSRLASLPVYHLRPVSDDELRELVRFRATRRGLVMNDDVLAWLLSRAPRSVDALMSLLAQIDEGAMSLGRPVTIPLLRELRLFPPDP